MNHDHCRRIFEWLRVWWGLITGIWLIGVSLALFTVALDVRATGIDQQRLAAAAKSQSENIQTERAESIRVSCYEQNSRNRLAVKRLRSITENPVAIRRTVLLIDALVPVRNCVELAEKRVRDR